MQDGSATGWPRGWPRTNPATMVLVTAACRLKFLPPKTTSEMLIQALDERLPGGPGRPWHGVDFDGYFADCHCYSLRCSQRPSVLSGKVVVTVSVVVTLGHGRVYSPFSERQLC